MELSTRDRQIGPLTPHPLPLSRKGRGAKTGAQSGEPSQAHVEACSRGERSEEGAKKGAFFGRNKPNMFFTMSNLTKQLSENKANLWLFNVERRA